MNSAHTSQSFSDWQPPSPRSTPQSAKFSSYHFLSPPSSEPSPAFQHGWMTPQGYVYDSALHTPGVYVNSTPEDISMASNLKRPRPISYQNVQVNGHMGQYTEVLSAQPIHPSVSFPSHSFLEQFHDTHIDNVSNDVVNTGASIAPPNQVQTPPPTRKTATRRKPHPALVIPVETPSTILSRRSSDHEAWVKRSGNSSASEMSPFQMTPLQISPPDPTYFSSGPLTAPVYPHSQLFWDPNSSIRLTQTAQLPITTENPFMGNNQNIGPTPLAFRRSAATPAVSAGVHDFVVPALPSHVPTRPLSAKPAEANQNAMLPPPRSATHLRQASSVDPSMLVSAQVADPNALSRPNSVVNNANPEDRQPYQCQIEALRREREGRVKKTARRQATVNSATACLGNTDLRRSLADGRARKTISLPQGTQAHATPDNQPPFTSVAAPIARNGSPLKRQKSSLQPPAIVSPLKSVGRKSVVLTVDAKGTARAQVKTIDQGTLRKKGSTASSNVSSSESDSDSPDLLKDQSHPQSTSALSSRRSTVKSSPPTNDAQNALREVVKANHQRKKDTNINLDGAVFGCGPTIPSSNLGSPPYSNQYTATSWNLSPAAMSDPDDHSPVDHTADYLTDVRCVCNNAASEVGKTTIQCQSCLKHLHAKCLGFSENAIPRAFHCAFCTGNMPTTRSNRVRSHTTPAMVPYYTIPAQNHHYF